MTVTYDLVTIVGKIRLIIGDTTIADAAFTDEELTYFYTAEGDINLAAAAALEAWAAKYAANADSEKIDDYSYSQKTIDNMQKLATQLKAKVATTPAMDWASFDFTGTTDDEALE